MALIKLGALTQDVRGSLNGTVFARNKGGAFVRTKVSPVQPVSSAQAASRQAFKIASQAWAQQLTDAERAAWIAFAATHPFINVFGDSIVLSGVAFFQAANKRLQQLGFPMPADPPASWDVDPPGDTTVVASLDGAGNISITFTPTAAPSSGSISAYVFATKAIPPGAQPQKNMYRLLNDGSATVRNESYDWGTLYKNYFTPYLPNVGDKLSFLYIYIDTTTGAISVRSVITDVSTGIPGPSIAVGAFEKQDAGAGNIQPILYTDVPHGLTTGDEIACALTPPDAVFDTSSTTITVLSATALLYPTVVGTPAGFTTTGGSLHRVS